LGTIVLMAKAYRIATPRPAPPDETPGNGA
jgi:hypothetical protein